MPHLGQSPGLSLTTSGCIGQTYSVFPDGGPGACGSKAIPHLGQSPGPSCTTSGCIGQVCCRPPSPSGSACSVARFTCWSGSARNFSRQCSLQKTYLRPLCVNSWDEDRGSRSIPHTGSLVCFFSETRVLFISNVLSVYVTHGAWPAHCKTAIRQGRRTIHIRNFQPAP